MAEQKEFYLPDLGEGLPDAEIIEWHVKEGDSVLLDQALVSMETAKAVVEVPSPYSGKVVKFFGQAGDVIKTGAPLASFALDASKPQRAEAEATGHHHAPPPAAAAQSANTASAARNDSGTVVGAMVASDHVVQEQATMIGGVKAMPAVRALAKKLGVNLGLVKPSGKDGVVSVQDVKQAAQRRSAGQSAPAAQHRPASSVASVAPVVQQQAVAPIQRVAAPAPIANKPVRTSPPTASVLGQPEPLRGVRRNMARVMADSHSKVVPTTLVDDADIHAWPAGTDITMRLIRSLVVASKVVPALNAWFDGDAGTRTMHERVDVGIAVDTEEGLFVPALRNADILDAAGIRTAINRIRDQVKDRSIPADELKGYTIMLSNFGVFAGRYATPVVVPPCVAIIAAGKSRHQLVPVMGGIETHRIMPISLTFDHRAATGGEAARFLKEMLDDLQKAM